MTTLADFKRRIKKGVKLHTINHNNGDMGIREISIVQTNSFALKTTRPSGEIVDSWSEFPKAKNFEVVNENEVNIFWGENEKREKILTYKFV